MCEMIVPVLIKECTFELAFVCFTFFGEISNVIEQRLIGIAVYEGCYYVNAAVSDVDSHVRSVLLDG